MIFLHVVAVEQPGEDLRESLFSVPDDSSSIPNKSEQPGLWPRNFEKGKSHVERSGRPPVHMSRWLCNDGKGANASCDCLLSV